MRLDAYTLYQAAARWPRETLSPRAAQSFLRSLAEEAEAQRSAAESPFGVDPKYSDDAMPPLPWEQKQ